jgi:mannose-6-phosphate isomerase
MTKLYPLKFTPILKDKIWGGNRLKTLLNKDTDSESCGESWELSGVPGDISVVANGFLAGNNLEELLEVYMTDLAGEKVYNKFGNNFPLLIKFIDASDNLSVQVHPDDKLAAERHNSFGKTEMWYVVEADKDAELIVGFNRELEAEEYVSYLNNGKVMDIMNREKVDNGDVFFIPAGRVHAIGAGILLAEIQQTSDVTYRIYDFERKDANGNFRELHTDLALDAIDFNVYPQYKSNYEKKPDQSNGVVECPYFTTNVINLTKEMSKEYTDIDSFVIYMCVKGHFRLQSEDKEEIEVRKGETVLIPSVLKNNILIPEEDSTILEIYID